MINGYKNKSANDRLLADCVSYFRQNDIWKRVFEGFKDKYASYGRFGGKLTIRNIKEADIEALEGFFGQNFHGKKSVTISAAKFAGAIKNSKYAEVTPEDILTCYFGKPLLGKAEKREMYERKYNSIIQNFLEEFKGTPSAEICEELEKIVKTDDLEEFKHLLWLAAKIYNNLPYRRNQKMYLAVFAAGLTGNPHAFDNGTSDGNILYQVVQINLQQRNLIVKSKELFQSYKRQKSYLLAGIMIDDISNYAMLYNVRATKKNGIYHSGISGFSQEKDIMQISLNVLAELESIECVESEIYIVENPSVFAVLCGEKSCMCMNGQPRLAGLMVLELIAKTGTHIYYSGDLDPEGLLIAQKLAQFYDGKFDYWHMTNADYEQCISKESLSERRIAMLDKIYDKRLISVANEIRKTKLAGYQENVKFI